MRQDNMRQMRILVDRFILTGASPNRQAARCI
jgi:hypothetical protein